MKIGTKKLDEWGIVTEFDIGDPVVKTKQYEVPGRHGAIDASEALTGYPIYGNRSIEIVLYIHGKSPEEYQATYDDIYAYCHGKVRTISFPFDKGCFYEGRLKVKPAQKDLSHGIVTISADCYPYAFKEALTIVDISSSTTDARHVVLQNAGMPTKIHIETDAEITIERRNSSKTYGKGNHTVLIPLLIDSETIIVSGAATAHIYYQEGKL